MIIPIEVRCVECRKLFCCASCRRQHELRSHGIQYDCGLCRRSVLTLHGRNPPELIEHVQCQHLPLHCVKCGQVFTKMEELVAEGKCVAKKEVDVGGSMKTNDEGDSSIPSHCKSIDILKDKFAYMGSEDKAGVMTSTPTHHSNCWGMFQKSFTSTLSGIHSPNSDVVVQSPPTDVALPDSDSPRDGSQQSIASKNQMSSIHPESSGKPPTKELKSIIAKTSVEESMDKPDEFFNTPRVEDEPEVNISDKRSYMLAKGSSAYVNSSSERRKRVTFAMPHDVRTTARIKPHVFLKPRRTSTPGRMHLKRNRTPRFQAIINNFESKSHKLYSTPRHLRNQNQTHDLTPPSTDPSGAILARTIDFKQSPTMSEESNPSPKQLPEEAVDSPVSSPNEADVTVYKSVLDDSLMINEAADSVKDLPKEIADSIKETINTAFDSKDCSTEIQFKIVITKKIVSIKETSRKMDEQRFVGQDNFNGVVNQKESTTIWSRLMDGVKWVIWGKQTDEKKIEDPNYSKDALLMSTSKRKRILSDLSDSPIANKRHRYSGRIKGRRPLDRIFKSESFPAEISNATQVDALSLQDFKENLDENQPLNQSF